MVICIMHVYLDLVFHTLTMPTVKILEAHVDYFGSYSMEDADLCFFIFLILQGWVVYM